MAKYTVGFIGCGNMGGPMIRAIAKAVPSQNIAVSAKDRDESDVIAKELGVIGTDKEDVAQNSEVIFLCIKPQTFPQVTEEISEILNKRKDRFMIVSIAAGLRIDAISEMLKGKYPIIRCMPNTPVAVGSGMTTFCHNANITSGDIKCFEELMQYSGTVAQQDESLMDAGCSVAGCGPAFVAMFADGLAQGGKACGLTDEQSLKYALQTLYGTARLMQETGISPEELVRKVCSPGGSTIEGVKVLREECLTDTVQKAVSASNKRNIELGK